MCTLHRGDPRGMCARGGCRGGGVHEVLPVTFRSEPGSAQRGATDKGVTGGVIHVGPRGRDRETTFAIGADGLTQRVKATNLSHDFAPWGTGPHPYLVAPGDLDDWTLTLPAAQVLTVTPDRLSPVGLQPVTADAERFDFREPRTLGAVMIDHAYTDLVRDRDGLVTARVTDAHGAGAAITWDSRCPWVQVHTADQPGGPDAPGHRAGLAVEPMTCAPDAFNDDSYPFDTGLGVIAPGDASKASWRISALS